MKHALQLRVVPAALLVLPLAACGGFSPTLGVVQFNGATLPLPANYRAIVAHAAATLPVAKGRTLGISQPQTMVGVTALDPRRWYVCLDGVTPPVPPAGVAPPAGRYDTIVVLEQIGPPLIQHGYASEPCAAASFSPLPIPKTFAAG